MQLIWASKIIDRLSFFLILAILLAIPGSLMAQPDGPSGGSESYGIADYYRDHKISGEKEGVHEFAFWGGYSFHSTRGIWGKTPGANLSVLGFRYNRKLLHISQNYLLKYVGEVNIHVNYQFSDANEQIASSSMGGFGVAPLGFQLNWKPENTLQPFFKTSTGFMNLSSPFPDQRGTRFNFILEIGGGLEIKIIDHAFFTLGYKYHHMSNGQLGEVNPGVDSNMLYGGITIY